MRMGWLIVWLLASSCAAKWEPLEPMTLTANVEVRDTLFLVTDRNAFVLELVGVSDGVLNGKIVRAWSFPSTRREDLRIRLEDQPGAIAQRNGWRELPVNDQRIRGVVADNVYYATYKDIGSAASRALRNVAIAGLVIVGVVTAVTIFALAGS
jgi:hypothetical protein